MPVPRLEGVVAHWSQLVENFQTSPKDYYDAVEEAVTRRKIPGLTATRAEYSEAGALTPNREYLCLRREKLVFDLCAAPFGTGFFFSSWLAEQRRSGVAIIACWVVMLVGLGLAARFVGPAFAEASYPVMRHLGWAAALLQWVLGLFVWLGIVAFIAGVGFTGFEDAILVAPLLGPLYARVFKPPTYYRQDTMRMFQAMVHNAMLEVIDGLMTKKGLRALSEDERKPILMDLVRR